MPSALLKSPTDPGMFFEWSTIVEGVTWVGNREEAVALYGEEAVTRAETTGTSREDGETFAYGYSGPGLVHSMPEDPQEDTK